MSIASDLFRFMMISLETKMREVLEIYRSEHVSPEDKVHVPMTIADIILIRRAMIYLQENIRSDDIKEIMGQIGWEKAKRSVGTPFVSTSIVNGSDSASSHIHRQFIPLSQDAFHDFISLSDSKIEKNEVDSEGNLPESENI